MEEKKSRKWIKKLVFSAIGVIVFIVVLILIYRALGWHRFSKDELQEYLSSKGAWALFFYFLLSFLQVSFIPLPSTVTILAGNYLFGTWQAFLVSYFAMLLGSLVAFLMGRWIGRPFVNWVVGDPGTVDNYLKKLKGKEKVTLFFMFLFPFFPDDVLCSVAGILPLSWWAFLLMQILTRATSIGATLFFMSGEIIPYHGWGLVVLISVSILGILAFVICFRHAEVLEKAFFSLFGKKDKIKSNQPGKTIQSQERPD